MPKMQCVIPMIHIPASPRSLSTDKVPRSKDSAEDFLPSGLAKLVQSPTMYAAPAPVVSRQSGLAYSLVFARFAADEVKACSVFSHSFGLGGVETVFFFYLLAYLLDGLLS